MTSHWHALQHYRVLGLDKTATQDDIKQAYRQLARTRHPDKGGSTEGFAALQAAFETLSDPKARAAYDSLATDLRFRPGAAKPYVSSQQEHAGTPPPPPGVTEAMLLQQLLQRGAAHPYAVFDPLSQLCVTCEVCTRPATQQCWTCGMDICEFCTRRQHWKGPVSLHWPLVNQPNSMLEQLGRRELELKRREDGQAYKEAQPDYRPQSELQVLRQFQDAIVDILQQQQQQMSGSITTSKPTGPANHLQKANAMTISNSSSSSSSSGVSVPAGVPPTSLAGCMSPATAARYSRYDTAQLSRQPGAQQQQQQASAFALPRSTMAPASSASSNTRFGRADGSCSAAGALVSHANSSSSTALSTPPGTGSTAVAVHSSSKAVQKCWKAWREAPEAVRQSLLGGYDNRLARFYMWAQTECSVILAVHMPTGGGKHPPKMNLEPTPTTLMIQHQGFAPLLSRAWHQPIDAAAGISSWSSGDGHLLVLRVGKAQLGRMWTACFKGDPHLARHLQSPYRLVQLPSEIQLDLPVPFWVHLAEDVTVTFGTHHLTVTVDGVMTLRRTFYIDSSSSEQTGRQAVDSSSSSWCLMEEDMQHSKPKHTAESHSSHPIGNTNTASSSSSSSSSSSRCVNRVAGPVKRVGKILSITLALPDPTDEELMYKKGVRQNNAAAVRSCPHGGGKSGMAFFKDDEDEWGLQAVLQAVLFHETGRTWLTPKPWELAAGAGSLISSSCATSSSDGCCSGHGLGGMSFATSSGRWADDERALPADVAAHLQWLRAAASAAAAEDNEGAIALAGKEE